MTRLTDKIDSCIYEPEKHEKLICLYDQLTVIVEKLKGFNDQFTSLTENPGNIETENEIFFEQNSRILNVKEKIQNYISSYIRSSNSGTSLNNSESKSKTSSSSSSPSRKRTKAESLLQQSQERFERKCMLLERQKPLELELKGENIIKGQNKLKSMQLKEYLRNA